MQRWSELYTLQGRAVPRNDGGGVRKNWVPCGQFRRRKSVENVRIFRRQKFRRFFYERRNILTFFNAFSTTKLHRIDVEKLTVSAGQLRTKESVPSKNSSVKLHQGHFGFLILMPYSFSNFFRLFFLVEGGGWECTPSLCMPLVHNGFQPDPTNFEIWSRVSCVLAAILFVCKLGSFQQDFLRLFSVFFESFDSVFWGLHRNLLIC